jgi:ribose 1,5-bisphosphokinase
MDEPDFVFPLRVITRADQSGEEHIYIPETDFARLTGEQLFFLNWRAHGLSYGIPASVTEDLESGRAVTFNISRRAIPRSRELW